MLVSHAPWRGALASALRSVPDSSAPSRNLVHTEQPPSVQPCAWRALSSTRAFDLNAMYWDINFTATASLAFTITGTFPADRYTSFEVYTNTITSFAEILDDTIVPDAGSVNPLVAGTTRGVGTYTLGLIVGPAPSPPLSNTIYANVPPSTKVRLVYRVYLPDSSASPSGNVPLPVLTAYNSATGIPMDCPPLSRWYSPPPSFTSYAGAFYREAVGLFPNIDTAYLETTINPITGTLSVIRFQSPTTPHTLAGGIEDMTTQVRYWSLCVYDGLTQLPIACPPDETLPLDANGWVTVALGLTGTQPGNATAANGVQWIDLGTLTDPDIILIRQTLPASSFAMSAFAVPISATAVAYMGSYAPQLAQCSTEQFEIDECLSMFPATLSLSPTELRPTQFITVTGANFGADEAVKVYWDITSTAPLTTITTTGAGFFVAMVRAPQAVVGTHTIVAVGQRSGSVGIATLQIAPYLVLAPSSGRSGATVVAAGIGFGATEPIIVSWNGGGQPLGSTISSAQGYFTGATAITFTVPSSATGSYRVCAKGKTSGATSCPFFTLTG